MKTITREELKDVLERHKLWLEGREGGVRADLSYADMRDADMSYADMRGADMSHADMRGADMSYADMSYADMRDADMSYANMSYANMSYADMHGADMHGADMNGADMNGANPDYSCLPLWCGSLSAHFDDRQLAQIVYHIVKAGLQSKNASDKTKKELAKLVDFANTSHLVERCGKIETPEREEEVK